IFGTINAWRSRAIFKPTFNSVLPGFLPAVALFSAYCVIEAAYDSVSKPKKIENNH
ncbi:hypothetical protein DICPUDRAFT_42131, partial [Dictyostelium purpureum]